MFHRCGKKRRQLLVGTRPIFSCISSKTTKTANGFFISQIMQGGSSLVTEVTATWRHGSESSLLVYLLFDENWELPDFSCVVDVVLDAALKSRLKVEQKEWVCMSLYLCCQFGFKRVCKKKIKRHTFRKFSTRLLLIHKGSLSCLIFLFVSGHFIPLIKQFLSIINNLKDNVQNPIMRHFLFSSEKCSLFFEHVSSPICQRHIFLAFDSVSSSIFQWSKVCFCRWCPLQKGESRAKKGSFRKIAPFFLLKKGVYSVCKCRPTLDVCHMQISIWRGLQCIPFFWWF